MGFAVSGIMVAVGLATIFTFTGSAFGKNKLLHLEIDTNLGMPVDVFFFH